jgi:hypothetical protein
MVVQCIKKYLTVTSLARLEPYQAQYMFEGIKYAPLMYKLIMRLATIDSIATTKTLDANLNNLPSYPASVDSNVKLINSYLIPTTPRSLQGELPSTTPLPSCLTRTSQYTSKKQDNYHDGNLGANFMHKNLMAQVTDKFTYLCCAHGNNLYGYGG